MAEPVKYPNYHKGISHKPIRYTNYPQVKSKYTCNFSVEWDCSRRFRFRSTLRMRSAERKKKSKRPHLYRTYWATDKVVGEFEF